MNEALVQEMDGNEHQGTDPAADRRTELAGLLREKARRGSMIHPLSHGQQALWFLHRSDPDSPAYHTAFAARLRSQVDIACLRKALEALVVRHTALRTSFPVVDCRPVQQVHGFRDLCLEQIDASKWSGSELSDKVHADYRRPFDLEHGPLTRVTLFSIRADDHVFLWTLHHIICDAWSLWVLMQELTVLYSAALTGAATGLAGAKSQFHEFVAWQNEMLDGPQGDQLWRYWRRKLSGELPLLDLATDRPRPPTQSLHGASRFFKIDEPLTQALIEVGKGQGATLYMTLLAAFHILLHRYSGQGENIVGSPVAGRNNTDFRETVGYFANPVGLRADLSGDPAFSDFLEQVRVTVLEALTYQDLPFARLIELLKPRRGASHAPIFQVMFVMQRPPKSQAFQELFAGEVEGGVEWGGLIMEPFELAQMEGQFDLAWEVVEGTRSLSCVLKYRTDLFDPSTIRRLEGHLAELLKSIVRDPGRRVSRLTMLGESERSMLLNEWNATQRVYPLDRRLHDWIEDQVAAASDAVAVEFADQALSYRGLNSRSNQLARQMRRLGVAADVPVGVCARRSLEMVVGLLAVLKAGGAYLPLDPEDPADRLQFMLSDAGVPVILSQETLLARLPEKSAQVVRLDSDWPGAARHSETNLNVEVDPLNLAYVIYTSGSTGKPKGAANTHLGICNRLLWMQERYRLDESDRVLQKTPFSFDVSVWEFFWPLMTGARLVVARPGGHKAGDYLSDTIQESKATTVHFVPSMLRVFLDTSGVERVNGTLRRVICSGEALSYELQQQFFDRLEAQLHNLYGPTEAAIDVTCWQCRREGGPSTVPIGKPIANTRIHLLDRHLQPTPLGVPGELHIGGLGLARGYWKRPGLTAEKFIPDPFQDDSQARLYKTGDLCRRLADGAIEFLQRIDHQVKVRGFRIELGEIETAMAAHPKVHEAVTRVDRQPEGGAQLLAWLVPVNGAAPTSGELRQFLKQRLPDYMIPAAFFRLDRLPLTPSGKCDRRALPVHRQTRAESAHDAVLPRTEVERRIADVWRETLKVDKVGIYDNFFDLGGHSLLLAQAQARLTEAFGRSPSVIELFRFPTIAALAAYFMREKADERLLPPTVRKQGSSGDLALVGMSCRFPGAGDVDAFWQNLIQGVESISHLTDEELLAKGVGAELVRNPNYVGAHGDVDGKELFDAAFFGFTPRQAEMMDPQQRLLLECAWTALEHSGHDPQSDRRRCGVFAGVGPNTYLLNNVHPRPELREAAAGYQAMLAHDKDYAATRVSYKLNLTGPSVTVQTACSTSLVAVHLACRSVLAGECEMALAGGCSISLPGAGYLYQPEMILSPDGHCRAFDKDAQGTVGGSGAAFVVVKRLEDALQGGDTVYAVIKGSAINNDGSLKAGYTAPSIDGQASVIDAALRASGVQADSIGYIEAHGTGTALGDPIEVAALKEVFGDRPTTAGPCAIGSVKTNLGHLDTAAGVAGLIKAALSLQNGMLPPSLHYRAPNPKMDLAGGRLRINAQLQPWKKGEQPRRAGVSSFGIGGTNAHVVLEEPPPPRETAPGRAWQLLLLSARSQAALDAATADLADYLRTHSNAELADVAFTLACGRRHFDRRRLLVCRSPKDALRALDHAEGSSPSTSSAESEGASPAFMFPGQGSQCLNMALELYQQEPVFREQFDRCSEALRPHLQLDLRDVLYPGEQAGAVADPLKETSLAQPALFVVEYALSQLWVSWGVSPQAMIGHSIGEYVAACLSGVMSLQDALALVAQRGEIMQRMPVGGMLALSLPEREVQPLLGRQLSLAAVNGPNHSVVSGPQTALLGLAEQLEAKAVPCRRLHTSHAFHSAMMDPAVAAFRACVERVDLCEPSVPFVSNVTGTWIEAGQATDPEYWAQHLRRTVRFDDGLKLLLQEPRRLLVEVGPGNVLGNLARRHPQRSKTQAVVTSMPHPQAQQSDMEHLLTAAGKLWLAGAPMDWSGFYAGQRRQRLPLPTYPFQRQRFWIDPPSSSGQQVDVQAPELESSPNIDDWFFIPSWQRSLPPIGQPEAGSQWLLFLDPCGLGDALGKRLEQQGACLTCVREGPQFDSQANGEYALNPSRRGDFDLLFQDLSRSGRMPQRIIHLWNCTPQTELPRESAASSAAQGASFFSLIHLAQALGERTLAGTCRIVVVSNNLHNVTGAERLDPAKALLLGPVAVIPQEYAQLDCTSIDVEIPAQGRPHRRLVEQLLAEPEATDSEPVIAYRGGHRWVRNFVPVRLQPQRPRVRDQGVYLITGGSGGLGLELAEWLAQNAAGVKLALTARSELPPRSEWQGCLESCQEPASPAANLQHRNKIERLNRLEKTGAEVLLLTADASDPEQMRSALGQVREQFGQIHGVVHAAGIAGGGTIRIKTPEDAQREFAGRVGGSLVLDELLSGQPLDFFVLCSSHASATGGFGQVAYCASCSFMDAFADYRASCEEGDTQIVAINWDRWQGLGMAAAFESLYSKMTGQELTGGLLPAEGSEAFGRVLASGLAPRVVVSTRDFGRLVKQSQTYQLGRFEQQLPQLQLHARPDLANDYAAPANDIEKRIARTWEEELGIDRVGRDDDFVSLGGDSLIAIKLAARLRDEIQVHLNVRSLYEQPTVAALAEHVAALQWAAQGDSLSGMPEHREEGVL